MKTDDTMRARLKALADHERLPELDARQRARVERSAKGQLRRAETLRSWALGLAAPCALAVAGLLLFQLPGARREPVGADARSLRSESKASPRASSVELVRPDHFPLLRPPIRHFHGRVLPPPYVSTATVRATTAKTAPRRPRYAESDQVALGLGCAEHRESLFRAVQGGHQELDLGPRALLVATHEARIAHALSAACDVSAELARGSVAVHARDLRGRSLVVRTPRGDVTVKGTIFEVTFEPERQQLRVAVDEGLVEVHTKAGKRFEIGPGVSLSVGTAVVRERLPHAVREALRRRLGLPSAKSPARSKVEPALDVQGEPSVISLEVIEEARAWRSGSVEKPQLAPEPGSSVTEEGRPMMKPRVVGRGASSSAPIQREQSLEKGESP